jgi:hypothetical protein
MPPLHGVLHLHHYLPRVAKSIREGFSKALRTLDAQLGGSPQAKLEPVLVRNSAKQPLHPLARIRQSQSRWYSTICNSASSATRSVTTTSRSGVRYDRASLPKSNISNDISRSPGRAPFAHTLRPNLSGGTLGRTAGGYSLGSGRVGGARYFSHGPACQAQVVQNVSQAMRAFFIGGQKAQFDGMSPRGEKRYKAVSALQEETERKLRKLPKATPGSYVDFRVNPTVTALTPLSSIVGFEESAALPANHLNTEGLLDCLSADFSRALKDLAATLNDLRRLSALGDLPITYHGPHIRVHFPGVDAETVERLCEELNVTRGTVVQDKDFDAFAGTEIALLFPFAPSEQSSEEDCASLYEAPAYTKMQPIDLRSLMTPSESPAYSTQSAQSDSDLEDMIEANPWLSSPSGFETVRSSPSGGSSGYETDPLEYQGFEGIYRFISELDSVRAPQ